MSGLNIFMLCCVCIFHYLDNGAALNGRQKRQPSLVDLTIVESQLELEVQARHPKQGLCSTPFEQNGTVGLRIYFKETFGKEVLESDYVFSAADSKLSVLRPSKNVEAIKYMKGSVYGIAFKACVVDEVTIECDATNSVGTKIGRKLRSFKGLYAPMVPAVDIETHLEGSVIRHEKTKFHCIGYVGTRGKLELRVTEPNPYSASKKQTAFWSVYFRDARVDSNADTNALSYTKGHGRYGPYIRARVEVKVTKDMKFSCKTINSLQSRQKWKSSPPQISIPKRPKLHVLDGGKKIFLLCSNSAFETSENLNTRLFYKDIEGLLIFSKESGVAGYAPYRMYRMPNKSYMGEDRQFYLREARTGLQMNIKAVSTRQVVEAGCLKHGLQVCRIYNRNLTRLTSTPIIEHIASFFMDVQNLNEDDTHKEAFNFGQLVLLSVALGIIFGTLLTVFRKTVRGKFRR